MLVVFLEGYVPTPFAWFEPCLTMEPTSTIKSSNETLRAPLIYIVDDEPMVGQVVDLCLKMAGYNTQLFSDPVEAFHAFENSPRKPCLLLADYQMPGMDGLELIARCKKVYPDLKSISISGTLHVEEIETHAIRPDKFIRKPFFPKELLGPVKELLHNHPGLL